MLWHSDLTTEEVRKRLDEIVESSWLKADLLGGLAGKPLRGTVDSMSFSVRRNRFKRGLDPQFDGEFSTDPAGGTTISGGFHWPVSAVLCVAFFAVILLICCGVAIEYVRLGGSWKEFTAAPKGKNAWAIWFVPVAPFALWLRWNWDKSLILETLSQAFETQVEVSVNAGD